MLKIDKGIKKLPVKCVIYGVEGIGKTTFASHFPTPLFLDLDKGSQRMAVDRIHPTTWPDLIHSLDDITKESVPYSTIVIDTADMAAKLCTTYVCQVNGNKKNIEDFGYGKGYVVLAQEFSRLIVYAEALVDRGYNVVFIAHAMQRLVTKPDDTGSYDHWEMKLPGKGNNSLGALLKEWADLLLFADYKVIIREGADGKGKAAGGQRKMQANHTAFADAKNRFGLADILDFDFKEIASIIPERAITAEPPKEPQKEQPKGKKLLDELKARMKQGISEMEPAPITEKELIEAIHTVEDDPALTKIKKMQDIPESYIESLLQEDQWSGLKIWILNNLRTPF